VGSEVPWSRKFAAPGFSNADGTPLSLGLRTMHRLLSTGPAVVRRATRTIAARRAARLPALLAKYEDGRRFLLPEGDAAYAAVFFDGEHEPGPSAAVRRLLRAGDFAIDVGANVGWFTLLMKTCVGPDGEIWAVEPLPATRGEMVANLARNPHLPATIKPFALGASQRDVTIHTFASLPQGHASISDLGRDDCTAHTVSMVTLDDLLTEATALTPVLVKVDVEGAELEVLMGASGLLSSPHRPVWMLEINYGNAAAFGYRPCDLIERLSEYADHRILRAVPSGLEPERDPEHAPNGGMWVCVPPGRVERLAHIEPEQRA
jgi:FkbM family methyltransferase